MLRASFANSSFQSHLFVTLCRHEEASDRCNIRIRDSTFQNDEHCHEPQINVEQIIGVNSTGEIKVVEIEHVETIM